VARQLGGATAMPREEVRRLMKARENYEANRVHAVPELD
jgi:hypothetical protein